ncbi:PASTA domain-containing protein [Kitasatospora viridis]|uniref:PASTA domain-containing protein n=1 Tax=Kitasatospora viridis TaxID=281105 RepID=A0A561UQA3_9ACTN|nr:PASTA domain-containing protein [Kitasatospora viridis]TWG01542.1 PASTA domain-containing protein [Kitasatospora viridis]
MTSFDPHNGSTGFVPDSDSDFGKALIQAMDDFSHSASAPSFDSAGIVRRTRRRRGVLALAGSAAAVAAAVTLTLTLGTFSGGSTVAVAAAPTAAPTASYDNELPPSADVAQPMPQDTNANAVVVPDLIGMNQEQATHALRVLGLDVSVGQTHTNVNPQFFPSAHASLIGPGGQVPVGIVAYTSPAAGTRVAPGTIIGIGITHE